MNISTATLLNLLTPKLNNELKTKIETNSKDGKVDIKSLVQDKTVQTLLNDIFDDIITQSRSKDSLVQTLKNSKHLFELKDFQKDIKSIVKQLEQEPKFQTQVKVLKEFLIDIKDINKTNITSNITNSGIFLESKLKQIVEEKLPQTPKQDQQIKSSNTKHLDTKPIQINNSLELLKDNLIDILKNGLKSENIIPIKQDINNLENILKDDNISYDTKKILQIKTAISNILTDIKKIPLKNIESTIIQKPIQEPKIEQKEIVKIIHKIEKEITTLSPINILKNSDIKDDIKQNNSKNNITQDLKTILLQLDDIIEKDLDNDDKSTPTKNQILKQTVEKIISQIEFYQGISYLLPSTTTYLPFSWDKIEDGDISFNKSLSTNDEFSCQINLTLKEYGDTRILLQLDRKNNLSINIALSSDILKSKMQKALKILRSNINKIGLKLYTLNIFDLEIKDNPYNLKENLSFEFELKA